MAESRNDDRSRSKGSTAPEDVSMRRIRAARSARRVFFVVVCGILLAALTGRLGNRSESAEASGGGFELRVEYPRVTRPGLAVDITIEVRQEGGLGGAVRVAMISEYLAVFDSNDMDPDPVAATTTADEVRWLFDPPPDSDTMAISFDIRVQPDIQLRRAKGSVTVLGDDGRPAVSVPIETLVLP